MIKEASKFTVFIIVLPTQTLVVGFIVLSRIEKHGMVGKCKGD